MESGKLLLKRFVPLLRPQPRPSLNRRRKSPQTRKSPCSLNRSRYRSLSRNLSS